MLGLADILTILSWRSRRPFTLGLVGGGGSILAVYRFWSTWSAFPSAHVAIGTSAVAVAAKARRPIWSAMPAPET